MGARLNVGWTAGTTVWLATDASAAASYTLGASDVAGDGSYVNLDFGKMSSGATKVFAAVLGKKGKSSLDRGTADIAPAFDGSLEESLLLAAGAEAGSGSLSFGAIVPMVEFVLASGKVSKVAVGVEEDALPERFSYDLVSGDVDVVSYVHEITIPVKADGNYYFPIVSGAKVGRFHFGFYDAEGNLLLQNDVEGGISVSPGRVLMLGEVDKEVGTESGDDDPSVPEGEYHLTVPMVFNSAGSATWPFNEGRGSNSRHSSVQVFHTIQGFAVFFSGIEHVLHSSNGWVTVVRTESDYVEFPTFTKARITGVKVKFGTSPSNPEFVDSKGNVIAGGEQLDATEAGGEYTYEFTGTEKGEPCRMRFKTKKNVSIIEMTPSYVFDSFKDADFTEYVTSVHLNDDSGASELSTGIGVNGFVQTRSGSLSGVTCGVEYRDYYSNSNPVPVDCTPSAFSYTDAAPSLTKYLIRAWAAPEYGWREYTEERIVYPNSLVLDFFHNGEVVKAFDNSCITKSSSGTYNYSNTEGLVLTSSGTSTYVTFPAIPGKALSEVLVVPMSTSDTGGLAVCGTPGTQSSVTLAESDLNVVRGTALICESSLENTAYSLVFTTRNAKYHLKRIVATYHDCAIPDKPEEEEPDDTSADPSGLFDYRILNSAGHPRLLANAADLAEIRRKVSTQKASNAVLCDANDCVMYYANYYLSKPIDLTYHLDASEKRLVEVSRSALLQLGSFSYAYNITGDSRYLNRAKILISQICGFPDWHPSHFLDTAEMTLAAAIAYDWLYNSLTLEERRLLHSRIVKYGLEQCLTSYGTYYGTAGNWNQVCACGMVAGALAVYEKDKKISADVIESNVVSNRNMAKLIYSPDGNYAEGYSYWRYGTGFQAILMGMLDELFGHTAKLDITPGLDKTAEYMLFMDGITGAFGYADGGTVGHAAKTGMWWLAKHSGDMSIVANELRLLKDVATYRDGSESRVLFSLPPVINKMDVDYDLKISHDKDLWYGRGMQPIVIVHTGWQWNEEDNYLGIKAGVPSDGHDHMDVGSFVYEAQGQRWSTDLGKYNYANMEIEFRNAGGAGSGQTSLRWDVLRLNNFGHSTISINAFDGSFQKRYASDHNFSGTGIITSVIETGNELGAVLDMGGPLKGQVESATRTIKLVNRRDLVIIDVIRAKDAFDAPVLWHMITPASVAVKSGYEVLTNGGKTMYLSTTSSIPLEIKYIGDEYVRPSWFTPRTWDEQENVLIAGYECVVPKGQTVTLTTVISPDRK